MEYNQLYEVSSDSYPFKKGDSVYRCSMHDYCLAGDDTRNTG